MMSSLKSHPGLGELGMNSNGLTHRKKTIDAEQVEEEKEKVPQLTLMEQLVLLGLKDSQGTLSFWNDSISYVLRGCILMELSLRNRITVVREHKRRPWADRVLEVLDDSVTGEVLLDETMRYMKNDSDTITNWIDYLSGETWNLLKIGYQLKQVRERIAKGLVDKGVLRTEKKNFLIFDMATHPVSDIGMKKKLIGLVLDVLFSKNTNPDARTIALVCAVYAANLLENVTSKLSYSQREAAFSKADEILRNNLNLTDASKENGMTDVVVGVINVYSKLDSIL